MPNRYITKRVEIHDFICSPERAYLLYLDDNIFLDTLTDAEFNYLIELMEE